MHAKRACEKGLCMASSGMLAMTVVPFGISDYTPASNPLNVYILHEFEMRAFTQR
jgi:hypothetical protein